MTKDRSTSVRRLVSARQWWDATPLMELGLSRRTYNALFRGGIKTIEELAQLPHERLEGIPNIGPTSLKEIDAQIAFYRTGNTSPPQEMSASSQNAAPGKPDLTTQTRRVRQAVTITQEQHQTDEWRVTFRPLATDKTPISALALPEDLQGHLLDAGFHTMADVAQAKTRQLLNLPGVGGVNVSKLRTALITYMLSPSYPFAHVHKSAADSHLAHLLSPETVARLTDAPLDKISIEQLKLAKVTTKQLQDIGVHTVGELIEHSSYLSERDAIMASLKAYLEWLARAAPHEWEAEKLADATSGQHQARRDTPAAPLKLQSQREKGPGSSKPYLALTGTRRSPASRAEQSRQVEKSESRITHLSATRTKPEPPREVGLPDQWQMEFRSLAQDGNSIGVLGVPRRVENALLRAGVLTIGGIASMSSRELMSTRSLGEQGWHELKAALSSYMLERTHVSQSSSIDSHKTEHEQIGRFDLLSLVPPELAATLKTAPLDTIPINRVGFPKSTYLRLKQLDVHTIGDLMKLSEYLPRKVEVIEPLQAYLGWLAQQSPSTWLSEVADIGPSPLHQNLLSETPVEELFSEWVASALDEKERNVIGFRFGLGGERLTLEELGQSRGVTRERIRQIEKAALRKLKHHYDGLINSFGILFSDFIIAQGGMITKGEGAEWFASKLNNPAALDSLGAVDLLCAIDQRLIFARTHDVIVLATLAIKIQVDAQTTLASLLSKHLAPASSETLVTDFCAEPDYRLLVEQWPQQTRVEPIQYIRACIRTHRDFEEREPGVYALQRWANRIGDNIVVALREIGEPAHFTTIAEAVNRQLPEDKQTTAHNVHAHMMRYESIFTRVGHGTYALVEWDLKQDDSIAEMAARTLREAGRPLHIETITDEVLTAWQVNRGTVYMALSHDGYYRDETGLGDLCMLLGDGVFTLSEWEAARAAEAEPTLPYCPAILPDPPDFENALFESVIVAHEKLAAAPRASEFLSEMFVWAGYNGEPKRWLQQGVLNSYYLLGLIPYTYIFGGDDPQLHSTLPGGSLGEIRLACLRALTQRLAHMPAFWGVLRAALPARQKDVAEAFAAAREDGLDDTGPRLTLLVGMGVVVRGEDYAFRLTGLGEDAARRLGAEAPFTVRYSSAKEKANVTGSEDLSDFAFWE